MMNINTMCFTRKQAKFKIRVKTSTYRRIALVLLVQAGILIIYNHICNTTRQTSSNLKTSNVWEYPNLLDMKEFEWIMNNEAICDIGGTDLRRNGIRLMPILVHTARNHFTERQAIRTTFGNIIYRGWITRAVFLLGITNVVNKTEEIVESKIKQEHKTYGDLVMGNFIDTYHNLTYKALMGYKWILNFCQSATFVTKIDDQVFLNITKWIDWRIEDVEQLGDWRNKNIKAMEKWKKFEDFQDWRIVNSSPQSKLSTPNSMYCLLAPRAEPYRNEKHKYYVSHEEWPEKYYPPYCVGVAWGVTVDVMKMVYEVHLQETRRVWHDDVFVTGVLVERAQKKYNFTFVSSFRSLRPHWTPYKRWKNKHTCQRDNNVVGSVVDSRNDFVVYAEIDRGKNFEEIWACLWNKTISESKTNVLSLYPHYEPSLEYHK